MGNKKRYSAYWWDFLCLAFVFACEMMLCESEVERVICWSEKVVEIESWGLLFFAGEMENSWKHVDQVWKVWDLSLKISRR